ncbi:MAG: transcription antitermination factor NusB [Parachlamydiales bacterium]|nr:transcription antitermination factor NusB [Parachlamydiales bacterium]
MPLIIQKQREIHFQILYSQSFCEIEKDYIINFLMKEHKTTKKNILISYFYILKVLSNLPKIDEIIKENSKSYDFSRISKVELNILRLAIFEMYFDENIPCKVSIAEAIRLTKKFANNQSIRFVNAVLDTAYKIINGN